MQRGNVGTDCSVERLRLTKVDPFGSLSLQTSVEDFGREDVRSEEFLNGATSIVAQLDRFAESFSGNTQGNAADESRTYFILRHELRGLDRLKYSCRRTSGAAPR
jgi:hypothetical protein